MSGSATGTYTKNKVVCTEIDQLAKLGYFDFIPRGGGHSITKHTGGWLEGLNQKPQNIYPKIAIFKKC